MSTPSTTTGLRHSYFTSLAEIQDEFARSGSGRQALAQRTQLVDSIVLRLWQELVSEHRDQSDDVALIAIGGYGRRLLFPYSDVDLLFLFREDPPERLRERIRAFSQVL